MKIVLSELDQTLKSFISAYLVVLVIGVSLGLYFLNHTTNMTPEGTVQRFRGTEISGQEEFDIPESYPRPITEMLVTTHNHVLGFSFIFGSVGIIFYFTNLIKGFWKKFLLIEPFISIVLSFGSIWLLRYVDSSFVYITVASAILMYLSFYIMVGFSFWEIWKKGN